MIPTLYLITFTPDTLHPVKNCVSISAHIKADLPILAAAVRENCPWLTTFNIRHYQPGHPSVSVLKPGDLILRVRYLLATLSKEEEKND